MSLGKPAVSLEKQTVPLEQCELCHLVSKLFVGFSSETVGLSSDTVIFGKLCQLKVQLHHLKGMTKMHQEYCLICKDK